MSIKVKLKKTGITTRDGMAMATRVMLMFPLVSPSPALRFLMDVPKEKRWRNSTFCQNCFCCRCVFDALATESWTVGSNLVFALKQKPKMYLCPIVNSPFSKNRQAGPVWLVWLYRMGTLFSEHSLMAVFIRERFIKTLRLPDKMQCASGFHYR